MLNNSKKKGTEAKQKFRFLYMHKLHVSADPSVPSQTGDAWPCHQRAIVTDDQLLGRIFCRLGRNRSKTTHPLSPTPTPSKASEFSDPTAADE
jgi:hypothetical protein